VTSMDQIIKLYPLPAAEIPLTGAYLAHNLRQYAEKTGASFVYANFVVSLDGRIAIPHPSGRGLMVPKATANERDWRLFQELAAQADIIISSGRYLRDWAAGRAQEILQVDDPRFADLREWRADQGLPIQPDIAIISASLDFPIPPVITAGGRKVVVFTSGHPDLERVEEIESQAGQVIVAGELLVQTLVELGYRTIYSSAGPKILHLLTAGGMLDRLYLTYANRMLGGQPFSSVLEGPLLDPPVGLRIHSVYLDPHALAGLGQLFVAYDRSESQVLGV
jgi:riboflavin biosynthesis pyrimidine reductase